MSGGLGGRSDQRAGGVSCPSRACKVAVEAEAGIFTGWDFDDRCRGSPLETGRGCRLDRFDLSRVGDTRATLLLEEEAGMEGRDLGEGRAWDERCRAGEDIEPLRKEGAYCAWFRDTADSGTGDSESRPDRRKLTLDSSLRSIPPCFFSFVLSSKRARSFPVVLVLGVTVPKSSARGAGVLRDRVAERMLCSRLDLMRLKGLDVDDSEGEMIVGGLERAEVVGGGGREGMAKGLETLMGDDTAATAIYMRD